MYLEFFKNPNYYRTLPNNFKHASDLNCILIGLSTKSDCVALIIKLMSHLIMKIAEQKPQEWYLSRSSSSCDLLGETLLRRL